MSSLTYELNGRNNFPLEKSDIGLIIGKQATGLKRVISNTWLYYERLQNSDKRVEEQKPKLRIVLKDHDEGITSEIISESTTIQKLAQLSLDKHIAFIMSKRVNLPKELIIEYPHRLLGKLIGKKASGIKKLISDSIEKASAEDISENDLEIAKTTRISIKEIDIQSENSEKIIEYAKQKSNRTFIAWPPEPDDKYKDHISFLISFKRDMKPFDDQDEFIRIIEKSIINKISEILEKDEEDLDEINKCLCISD